MTRGPREVKYSSGIKTINIYFLQIQKRDSWGSAGAIIAERRNVSRLLAEEIFLGHFQSPVVRAPNATMEFFDGKGLCYIQSFYVCKIQVCFVCIFY